MSNILQIILQNCHFSHSVVVKIDLPHFENSYFIHKLLVNMTFWRNKQVKKNGGLLLANLL